MQEIVQGYSWETFRFILFLSLGANAGQAQPPKKENKALSVSSSVPKRSEGKEV
jgi:hypothetical protein